MSLSSTFQKLEAFVEAEFKNVEGGVAAFFEKFEPVVEEGVETVVDKLGPVIAQLVFGLAQSAISGKAKFAAASAGLIAQAEEQGIAITTTVANTLIQQAVAKAGAVVSSSLVASKPVGN